MIAIEAVEIPATALIARAFPETHYADAYRAPVPAGKEYDIESVTRAFFNSAPAWVDALMELRDTLVRPLGLHTAPAVASRDLQGIAFQPGTSTGLFHVFQKTSGEIVLGENDRHLDFRASILLTSENGVQWVTLATVVHFNGWLGRAYFLPVRPFHKLIVPAMLKNMIRNLK